MEDAFVSFVSSCLLESERDVSDKVDEDGDDDHEIEDDICDGKNFFKIMKSVDILC